ncbi:hypothetical protein BH10PSE19_BH10PSE19_03530 [soil metagenome]
MAKNAVKVKKFHPKVEYSLAIPYILFHLSCLAVFWTGITTASVILCVALYSLRMWGVGAAYHRYFSHKSYKTSRVFQFILAIIAQMALQRGVLKWANDHRKHHRYSDTQEDMHSPRAHGFFYAHVGWIFTKENYDVKHDMMGDFKQYPELVWLDKNEHIPGIILGVIAWLIAGWPGLVVGFCWSTIIAYHTTNMINSLAHVFGSQRYITGDDSRNNWWLAILTFGEGWHNNHHHYPTSARQGFYWWEYDLTYYVLWLLQKCGIIWDMKEPTAESKDANVVSPRVVNISQKLLQNIGLDLSAVGMRLEEMKTTALSITPDVDGHTQLEALGADLISVRDTIKTNLPLTKQLPPKLAVKVRSKLEHDIKQIETIYASIKAKANPTEIIAVLEKLFHSLQAQPI